MIRIAKIFLLTAITLYSQDFTRVVSGLPHLKHARIEPGDCDNDGDIDLLCYGYATNNPSIYVNEYNYFSLVPSGLPSVNDGGVAWSDYDNDNDLDVLVTGLIDSTMCTRLFQNTDCVFFEVDLGLPGLSDSSCDFGDFDGDGSDDIILTGCDISGDKVTKIFLNDNGIFNELASGIPGFTNGSVKCFDFDNDGDDDFCISGLDSTEIETSRIYRNDSLVFVDIEAGMIGFNDTYISWGDYDNDSDADILISGFTHQDIGDKAVVYENNNGVFTNINASLNFLYSSSWGDCDNDGDLDIILHGGVPESELTEFYVNDNGVYTNVDLGFPDVMSSASAWFDYDNDGDTDLFLTGHYVAGQYWTTYYVANLYRNNLIHNPLFTEINAELPGITLGSNMWGDYDNDGDMDLLMTGKSDSLGFISEIYRNDGEDLFTNIDASLSGVRSGDGKWGDYDNDGDLDIALTGESDSGYITKIYRNDGGDIFTDINAGLPGLTKSCLDWGDYDHDGDIDLVISGYDGTTSMIKIFRNNSGNFLDINNQFSEIATGKVIWSYINSDNFLDLYIIGNTTDSQGYNAIYLNNLNGSFSLLLGFSGGQGGDIAFGDFDNDGDQDIIRNGSSLFIGYTYTFYPTTVIEKNNGDNTFTNINAGLVGTMDTDLNWGDIDNDGDLDALDTKGFIYFNDSGTFKYMDLGIPYYISSSGCLVDYDNDGDLDIQISGYSNEGKTTKILKNTHDSYNTAPNKPENLYAEMTEQGVLLSWNKAFDTETGQDGLSYNIYIGTSSDNTDLLDPMSNTENGSRKIIATGNAGQNTSWLLKNVPTGDYFWSVQAIDHGFIGSEFAAGQIFSGLEDNDIIKSNELFQNYPNPFNPSTLIHFSLSNDADVKLNIHDVTGRKITELINKKMNSGYHILEFNGSNYTSGIYFYKLMVNGKEVSSRKMMLIK